MQSVALLDINFEELVVFTVILDMPEPFCQKN